MKKKAFIYFMLAGASFLPAFVIFDKAPDNWIKWSSLTLLALVGVFFSIKQADNMKSTKPKDVGFIFTDTDTGLEVFMDLYKSTFHDITTNEELGIIHVHIEHEPALSKSYLTFSLIFHSPDQFTKAVTTK